MTPDADMAYREFEDTALQRDFEEIQDAVRGFAERYDANTLAAVYRRGWDAVKYLCAGDASVDGQKIGRLSFALGNLGTLFLMTEGKMPKIYMI